MAVIAVAADKGGSGKTTTASTLAQRLSLLEETWLLDFDSQGHCGLSFGLEPGMAMYDWLERGYDLRRCLTSGRPPSLKVLQSDPRTRNIERRLFNDRIWCQRVVEQLIQLEVPYIVVDTASRGPLQEIALRAAAQVVVPFCLDQYGLQGMYDTLAHLKQLGSNAKVTLVPVRLDIRIGENNNNLRKVLADFSGAYGLQDRAAVKSRAAVLYAQGEGKSIWEYESLDLRDVRSAYELLAARVVRIAAEEEGPVGRVSYAS